MKNSLLVVSIFLLMLCNMGFCIDSIFPEEFTSFLSLILSTIPVFKKGTDTRFGFGFRNNQNADAQVVFELGPQTYTQSLDADNSIDKREINIKDVPTKLLYRQPQSKTKQKLSKETKKFNKYLGPKSTQQQQQLDNEPEDQLHHQKPTKKVLKRTILDEDSFKQLKSLYKTFK